MTLTIDAHLEDLLELDERESNGIRVTLVWNRATDTASVLVWDERTAQSFAIEIQRGDNAYDVFHHPFAYAPSRPVDTAPAIEREPSDARDRRALRADDPS